LWPNLTRLVQILRHSERIEQRLDLAIYIPALEDVLLTKLRPQEKNIQAASKCHLVGDQGDKLKARPAPPHSRGFDSKVKSFFVSYGL
jgi:hypothetical protein